MSHHHHHDHDHDDHDHVHAATPYTQTFSELDFERSLHFAAGQGDLAAATRILDRRGSGAVDDRDGAGFTALVIQRPMLVDMTLPRNALTNWSPNSTMRPARTTRNFA